MTKPDATARAVKAATTPRPRRERAIQAAVREARPVWKVERDENGLPVRLWLGGWETVPLLDVFVPGPLFNPLNGQHGHWSKRARWARGWRDRTRLVVLDAVLRLPKTPEGKHRWINSLTPKAIAFHAQTGGRWDDDNLRAGMKPIRDGLKDAGLIHDDGPDSGHTFAYTQEINRKQRGVRILIVDDVAAALGKP